MSDMECVLNTITALSSATMAVCAVIAIDKAETYLTNAKLYSKDNFDMPITGKGYEIRQNKNGWYVFWYKHKEKEPLEVKAGQPCKTYKKACKRVNWHRKVMANRLVKAAKTLAERYQLDKETQHKE